MCLRMLVGSWLIGDPSIHLQPVVIRCLSPNYFYNCLAYNWLKHEQAFSLKAKYNSFLKPRSHPNGFATYLGQLLHLYSPWWSSLAIITSNHCIMGFALWCSILSSHTKALCGKNQSIKLKTTLDGRRYLTSNALALLTSVITPDKSVKLFVFLWFKPIRWMGIGFVLTVAVPSHFHVDKRLILNLNSVLFRPMVSNQPCRQEAIRSQLLAAASRRSSFTEAASQSSKHGYCQGPIASVRTFHAHEGLPSSLRR